MPWCSVFLHFIILPLTVGGNYLLYPFCECVLFLLCLNPACKTRVAELGGCGGVIVQHRQRGAAQIGFENSMEKEKGSIVEMAPILGIFLPKILFKVDLAWMEDPGFPTGGGFRTGLLCAHIQW